MRKQRGFTLVEVLIVVVIMAVLAATIVPQFADSTRDAKEGAALFNLRTLRAQLELYKSQHDGRYPSADLRELTQSTNVLGVVGTGADYPYGPYMLHIPENPFNGSATVGVASGDPPAASGDGSGWLYSPTLGKIWINNRDLINR